MDIYSKLKELGLELPPHPGSAGLYKPVKQVGNLLFVSGQVPWLGEGQYIKGKLGAERTLEEGQEAARVCVKNALSVLHTYLGDLNKIKSVVKILAFIQSAPGFNEQPKVANGASKLLVEIYGEERGKGARSAIGCSELPLNVSVEVEFIFEV